MLTRRLSVRRLLLTVTFALSCAAAFAAEITVNPALQKAAQDLKSNVINNPQPAPQQRTHYRPPPPGSAACTRGSPESKYHLASPPRWATSGYMDHGRVLNAITDVYYDTARSLEDLQTWVIQMRCEQRNLTELLEQIMGSRWVGMNSRGPRPAMSNCPKSAPNPSYTVDPGYVSSTGIADHGRILNTIDNAYYRWLSQYVDDLLARLAQLRCEQANNTARINYLIRVPYTLSDRGAAINDSLRNTTQPPPADRTCAAIGPIPSYVVRYQAWATQTAPAAVLRYPTLYQAAPTAPGANTSEGKGAIDHGYLINYGAAAANYLASALDDMQVRVERITCQQRNNNAKLDYFAKWIPG